MATMPMMDTSEPRYAEIARLMAESGDWITPWFEPGVPFWGKPPLAFWMSALSFSVFGYSDFAARLPVFVANLANLALIYFFARRRFGAGVAQAAAIIYATSLLAFVAGGAVLTDAYLTLAITLTLVAFERSVVQPVCAPVWRYLFFVGLALGMLAKGPLTFVLAAAVLVPWVVWHRLAGDVWRRMPWFRGIALFLLLALPWYIAAELKTPGFLKYFIVGEHFSRFVDSGWHGDLYGTAHQRAYGGIWLDWLLATFPWGILALIHLARRKRAGGELLPPLRRSARPITVFLLLWALATPLFFTFSGNILWTYVQPSLPAFAILFGSMLMHTQSSALHTRRWRAAASLVPLLGAGIGAVAWFNPGTLRTERPLIEYYSAHADARLPLYYLNDRPFSARYYSRGQAIRCDDACLKTALAQHPLGIYLSGCRSTPLAGACGYVAQSGAVQRQDDVAGVRAEEKQFNAYARRRRGA
ncbi:MAG: glycosyltransferase family 39 protein [Burkholderiaceae bacterium]|nr:glycosyltransferase family 39 protein [Burkholderiaceae bacterium]